MSEILTYILLALVVLAFFLGVIPLMVVQMTRTNGKLKVLLQQPWFFLVIVVLWLSLNLLTTYVSVGFYLYYFPVALLGIVQISKYVSFCLKRQERFRNKWFK